MLQLIEKIKLLNKYQKQINELSDERFNIFRICGVNHYETTHSSIITELLRNDSSHNFQNKFLEAFIETLIKENIIDETYQFSLLNVRVIPEFPTANGRIDIFINNENQCIIIENKIYAGDQFEQLKRYETFARNKYSENYLLLYLTLWGDEASEQSGKDVNYKQISYTQTIVKWLERCIAITARNPVIRETLIQYINHLNYLTNNTIDSKMNIEIVRLLSQEENIDALFTIGENLNNVKNHLINKVFIPQLNQVCEELNLINVSEEYDRVNTSYSNFVILNPAWKYFKIAFEFEAKGLRNFIKGINHIDNNLRNDKTFEILKTKFNRNNQNWVWSDFPLYNYWGKDAMMAIENGKMANQFKTEIEKIMDITVGLDM